MELHITDKILEDKKRVIVVDYKNNKVRAKDGLEVHMHNEVNGSENGLIKDMANYFNDQYEIDTIEVSDEIVRFNSDKKEMILTDYSEHWDIINALVDKYNINRDKFCSSTSIDNYVFVTGNESSYKLVSTTDKSGNNSNWIVFRVNLSGPTGISDSHFLKEITKNLFKNMESMPEEIKIAGTNVDGIDINDLELLEVSGIKIAYDIKLSKYIYNSYRDKLLQKGMEEDIKHGIEHVIKRCDNNDSK